MGLIGTTFYGLLSRHYLGLMIGRTLGPYSDALADVAFANRRPEFWRRMAIRHGLTILIEPVGGEPVAFDDRGERLTLDHPKLNGQIRAVRTAPDGTRMTLYWTIWAPGWGHLSSLAALLFVLFAVVGSAFWFLQRQLRPLAWLHRGVDALARGDFKARVPVVRDDEIGQVAGAFNDMARRVGEMIEDRDRLLADVSHELRSPIARMKVALEFVPGGGKREALARDLKEMENLIGALLEREGLRSRTGRLEGEEVDLDALAGEVAAGFAGRGPGVEFLSGGAMPIHADPALMKLLIQNLIDNAVKFSGPDSRPVMVKLKAEDGRAVLTVIDDGIGIPPGAEEKVLEPFVKLDRARGHGVGYGIGLNLCQRIVRLHGGSIRLLPREPRGTEAIVTLPGTPWP